MTLVRQGITIEHFLAAATQALLANLHCMLLLRVLLFTHNNFLAPQITDSFKTVLPIYGPDLMLSEIFLQWDEEVSASRCNIKMARFITCHCCAEYCAIYTSHLLQF